MVDFFTDKLGFEQGRINPVGHTTSFDDEGNVIDGTTASIVSGATETFALAAGDEFLIRVDLGQTQAITFDPADFGDITLATAAEVGAAIEAEIEFAKIKTELAEPFALIDGQTLTIRVNSGPDQTATFVDADFADISAATAAEVAAVLASAWTDVTVKALAGRVLVASTATGIEATIDVRTSLPALSFPLGLSLGSTPVVADDDGGGQIQIQSSVVGATGCLQVFDPLNDNANQVFAFATDEVCGTTGGWSFVLGHDAPGRIVTLESGDFVRIEQSVTFNDADIMRVFGLFRRPTSMPTTHSWEIRITVAGFTQLIAFPEASTALAYPEEDYFLIDFGVNISQLGTETVELALRFSGPAGEVDSELPAAYLDIVAFEENAPDMLLLNRNPYPNKERVPSTHLVSLMVVSTNGDAVDTANTTITIEGVVAFDGVGFVNGFSGGVSAGTGPSSDDALWVISIASQGYTSEQVIDVVVDSQTVGASAMLVGATYSFTIDDTVEPTLTAASAHEKDVVRVTFSEEIQAVDPTASNDALNPLNWSFTGLSFPTAVVSAANIERVNETTVDITLDDDTTINGSYRITVTNVEDTAGNVIMPPNNTVDFLGFVPAIPAGRRFNLFDTLVADLHRRDDIPIAQLEPFLRVLQDPLDICLCRIDRWTDILDPDIASENFIDAMLCSLGNPFRFDLDLAGKRNLLAVLVAIYQSKGTDFGIEDAVFFFLNIIVDVQPVNDIIDGWILGESLLGEDTELFTSDSSDLYTFEIISSSTLTEEERSRMLTVADFMKVGHEHIRIVEPVVSPLDLTWILGESLLGESTELSQTVSP